MELQGGVWWLGKLKSPLLSLLPSCGFFIWLVGEAAVQHIDIFSSCLNAAINFRFVTTYFRVAFLSEFSQSVWDQLFDHQVDPFGFE